MANGPTIQERLDYIHCRVTQRGIPVEPVEQTHAKAIAELTNICGEMFDRMIEHEKKELPIGVTVAPSDKVSTTTRPLQEPMRTRAEKQGAKQQ